MDKMFSLQIPDQSPGPATANHFGTKRQTEELYGRLHAKQMSNEQADNKLTEFTFKVMSLQIEQKISENIKGPL